MVFTSPNFDVLIVFYEHLNFHLGANRNPENFEKANKCSCGREGGKCGHVRNDSGVRPHSGFCGRAVKTQFIIVFRLFRIALFLWERT